MGMYRIGLTAKGKYLKGWTMNGVLTFTRRKSDAAVFSSRVEAEHMVNHFPIQTEVIPDPLDISYA